MSLNLCRIFCQSFPELPFGQKMSRYSPSNYKCYEQGQKPGNESSLRNSCSSLDKLESGILRRSLRISYMSIQINALDSTQSK